MCSKSPYSPLCNRTRFWAKRSPKKKLFVAEYLIGINAPGAHRKAGIKEKSHGTLGSRMLKKVHIAEAIEAGKKEITEKQGISQERVLAELAKVGFASMHQAVKIDQDGQPQINLISNIRR
nr:terminase small subunit [Sulfitobacter noctilucae]